MSHTEDYLVEEDLDNKSENYRELFNHLSKYTNDFSDDSGSFPVDDKSEVTDVIAILKQFYNKVNRSLDYKRSTLNYTDYKVEYSDPINENFSRVFNYIDKNSSGGYMNRSIKDGVSDYINDSVSGNKKYKVEDLSDFSEVYDLLCESDKSDQKRRYTPKILRTVPFAGPMGVTMTEDTFTEDIEKHDKLNPAIWDENDEMKPEVKEILQKVANKFIDQLSSDGVDLDVKDILVLGSNANYNYTKDSDIDLHIVADLSKYNDFEDLAQKFYDARRKIFNDKYDPMIKDYEVELYVEPWTGDEESLEDIGEEENSDYLSDVNESLKHVYSEDFNDFSELYSLVKNLD